MSTVKDNQEYIVSDVGTQKESELSYPKTIGRYMGQRLRDFRKLLPRYSSENTESVPKTSFFTAPQATDQAQGSYGKIFSIDHWLSRHFKRQGFENSPTNQHKPEGSR